MAKRMMLSGFSSLLVLFLAVSNAIFAEANEASGDVVSPPVDCFNCTPCEDPCYFMAPPPPAYPQYGTPPPPPAYPQYGTPPPPPPPAYPQYPTPSPPPPTYIQYAKPPPPPPAQVDCPPSTPSTAGQPGTYSEYTPPDSDTNLPYYNYSASFTMLSPIWAVISLCFSIILFFGVLA